jgi:hypothetical protein
LQHARPFFYRPSGNDAKLTQYAPSVNRSRFHVPATRAGARGSSDTLLQGIIEDDKVYTDVQNLNVHFRLWETQSIQFQNRKGYQHMPKDAHNKAAEHHDNAAKAHRTAAEHHGKGDHAAGKKHSATAHEDSTKAHEASQAAHKKSQEQK